ncbi:MAG: GlcG/HbpS family heme-binding protein [Gammaproteobacteria bacterium]
MTRMTLDLAEECIKKVKRRAIEMKVKMSIAVVDDAGKLVAYARMGEKRGSFGEKVAIAKARTAVAYQRTTKATMENFEKRSGNYYIVGMSGLYPEEFWAGPGGAPIIIDGEVIGGIGVSGSSPENDHKCVTEALAPVTRS